MVTLNESFKRYLLEIHILSLNDKNTIKTGELASSLQVKPASVTEMLSKMDEKDLVNYEKHKGVELTKDGEEIAREIMWKKCIVENFFEDKLNLDSDAEKEINIAQTLSEDVALKLQEYINHPCTNRCGAPIDKYNECLPEVETV